MKEFARYILAHVYAVVLGDKRVLLNKPFVASLKLRETVFDPERMKETYARFADSNEMHQWNLNPFALETFIPELPTLTPGMSPTRSMSKETTA
jgi:hypothetical protein